MPTRGDRSGTFSSKPLDNRAPDQPCATDHQHDVTAQSEIHADEASSASASHRSPAAVWRTRYRGSARPRPRDGTPLSLRWVDIRAQFASTALKSMGDRSPGLDRLCLDIIEVRSETRLQVARRANAGNVRRRLGRRNRMVVEFLQIDWRMTEFQMTGAGDGISRGDGTVSTARPAGRPQSIEEQFHAAHLVQPMCRSSAHCGLSIAVRSRSRREIIRFAPP